MDSEQIAFRASQIFHPAVIEIPGAIIALHIYGLTTADILFFAVMPITAMTTILYTLLRLPRYRGLDMNIQEDRNPIYPPAILLLCILAFLTFRLEGPLLIQSLYPGIIALSVVNFAINREVKISLHLTGMGVLTAIFTGVSLAAGGVLLAASALVAWSRIILNRHTLTEVMLGFFVSYSLVLTSLLISMGSS